MKFKHLTNEELRSAILNTPSEDFNRLDPEQVFEIVDRLGGDIYIIRNRRKEQGRYRFSWLRAKNYTDGPTLKPIIKIWFTNDSR